MFFPMEKTKGPSSPTQVEISATSPNRSTAILARGSVLALSVERKIYRLKSLDEMAQQQSTQAFGTAAQPALGYPQLSFQPLCNLRGSRGCLK